MSNVVLLIKPSAAILHCSACGAEAMAACNCGAPYVPAGARAAEAIARNPEKSDRAIAAEIGVSRETVRKTRNLGDNQLSPAKRVGKDGKSYAAKRAGKSRPKKDPKADVVREAIRETVKAGKPIERKDLAKKLDVSEGTVQTAVMQERAYLEGLQENGNAGMVSIQLLIEKLDPLFEKASTVAKSKHDNSLSTAGLDLKLALMDIANRGRQYLNEWASGNDTVHLTPGLKKDKARRDRARANR